MINRVGLLTVLLAVAAVSAASTPARTPPSGTAMFVVQHDTRLCPSPLCGGYWAALANGVRTRCGDGRRQVRCYVERVVDRYGQALANDIPEQALARGAIEPGLTVGDRTIDRLRVWATYATDRTAPVSGGFYRVVDTGIRCIRAPCFLYRVTQVNGSTSSMASSIDLAASGSTLERIERAQVALRSKDGLYAQGRFAATPDGGRIFRALRFYLRARQPRA